MVMFSFATVLRRLGISAMLLTAVLVMSTISPASGDTGCAVAVAPTSVSGVYEIDTAAKLQWAKDSGAMSNNYKLTGNINLSGCTWSNGLGTSGSPYSGTFDGNGKTISNLTVSGGANQGIAFVDFLTGSITNLTLSSPSSTGTNNYVGALVGDLRSTGTVSNITLTSISVSGGQISGGAIGQVQSGATVSSLTVSGSFSAPSGAGGGAFGTVEGTVSNVTSTVTVTGDYNLGGIAGNLYNGGSINNSFFNGNVTGTFSVGGAVGFVAGTSPTCGTLTEVTTAGNISGTGNIGGLIGDVNCYKIQQSSSTAVVTASSTRAGGLVGYENTGGSITRSFFAGQVQGTEQVGGIAGASRSTITDSYSTGSVTATSGTNGGRVGGLVGWLLSGATVTRTFASGTVTPPASGTSTVGGLIGNYGGGTITSSIWDTQSTGRSTSQGTGAKGYTTQQMKNFVLYDADNLNWGITNGISSGDGVNTGTTWSICSSENSGYPFLTWQSLSGTCRPTVAYNGNGNTSGTAPTDGSTPYASGANVTVLGNTGSMAKTGNLFSGWNTKADGTGTSYAAGEVFSITSPVMLFAEWTSNPVVAYRPNGGTGTINNTTAASGSTITLSNGSGFTRTNYLLTRWDTSATGNGTPYSKSDSITMPANGLVLFAVWTLDPNSTTTTTTTTTTSTTTTTVPPGGTPTTVAPPGGTSNNPTDSPNGSPSDTRPGGSSSPSRGGSSTASSTIPATSTAPTSSTTPATSVEKAPDIANVETGRFAATVDGKAVPVDIREENGSLVADVGGGRITLSFADSDGLPRRLTPGEIRSLAVGDRVRVDLAGYASGTEATAWVTPDGVALGKTTLRNGAGVVDGVVPDAVTPGERRITVATESSTGEPVVIAYGVQMAESDSTGATWSRVLFVILGLAIVAGLVIPSARRRRRR